MLGHYNHPHTGLNVILYKEIFKKSLQGYLKLKPKSICFHILYKSLILANFHDCI